MGFFSHLFETWWIEAVFCLWICRSKTQKRGDDKERRKRSPSPKPTKVHLGRLTRNVTKVSWETVELLSAIRMIFPLVIHNLYRLLIDIVLLSAPCYEFSLFCKNPSKIINLLCWCCSDKVTVSFLRRTTSRRYFPLMEKSKWLTCQWTVSTLTCPGAMLTWSLRVLMRLRRPSNTWMEVCHNVLFSGSASHIYWARNTRSIVSSLTLLFKGQIDGQEISASAVLTQRVRPPPRRPSPPRRMPPPPPMWRRSPPRMRRRYI